MSDKTPKWINDLALDVYRIIQQYDAMPQFRDMLKKWMANYESQQLKQENWKERRRRHFEEVVMADPCLRDQNADPPKQGWKWEMHVQHIYDDQSDNTDIKSRWSHENISGWVPPDLSYDSCPKINQLFPLNCEHELDITEKYICLTAIYEYARKGTEAIDPFPWPEQDEWDSPDVTSKSVQCFTFDYICNAVSKLNSDCDGWLRILLDDVTKDITNWKNASNEKTKPEHAISLNNSVPKPLVTTDITSNTRKIASPHTSKQIPTLENLDAIVQKAKRLIQVLSETFCISDQTDPPGFSAIYRTIEPFQAIEALERELNPQYIPFGGNNRKAIAVANWPDVSKLSRALVWLSNLHDGIIKAWKLEPICENKGLAIMSQGGTHAKNYAPGIIPLTVNKDWPPKVEREVVKSIDMAITWIEEVTDLARIRTQETSGNLKGNKKLSTEVFYVYSHKDETLRDELGNHLSHLERQGIITGWHDRKIVPGKEGEDEIDEHINSASIILLLISSNFFASDYCYKREMTRAMERHEEGTARVIPIILRDCDWVDAPFRNLQVLPKDAMPVTSWPNQDEAFTNIAKGIRESINDFHSQ